MTITTVLWIVFGAAIIVAIGVLDTIKRMQRRAEERRMTPEELEIRRREDQVFRTAFRRWWLK